LAQVQKRKWESRWRPLLEHRTRSIPVYRDDRIAEAVKWWQFVGDISGQRDANFILLARRLKSAGCDSGEFASLMTRPAATRTGSLPAKFPSVERPSSQANVASAQHYNNL